MAEFLWCQQAAGGGSVEATQFMGSVFREGERAPCLQLTGAHGYVQFTRAGAVTLVGEITRWLAFGVPGESS